MNTDHAAPLVAALQGVGGLRVFDGPVAANTPPPYTVIYVAVSTPEETSIETVADRIEATAYVHSVGASAGACRIIADRAWGALVGVVPVVAGRTCSRIRQIDSQPATRDETTGVTVMDQVDVYQYVSMA